MEGILEDPAGKRVSDVIARIYEIHAANKTVALGSALFLSIPGYVEAVMRDEQAASANELIAEAYLSSFGTWLAQLDDDTLEELGRQMSQGDALGSEWPWVLEQLSNLA